MIRKRITSVLIGGFFLLLVMLFATPVHALEQDGFTYGLSGYGVVVLQYDGNAADLTIPDKVGDFPVVEIEADAFQDCESLTAVHCPDTILSIGAGAFAGCKNLREVTLPDYLTSIDSEVFRGCTSLTELTIPEGVTGIYENAFGGCESLAEVTLPNSVESIYDAFNGCSSLSFLTVPDGCVSFRVADCSALKKLRLGASVYNVVIGTGCDSLTEIEVDAENAYYSSADGVLYNEDQTELLRYPEGRQESSFTVPEGVTRIDYAFQGNRSLTQLVLPDSLTSIMDSFQDCDSLKELVIPNNCKEVYLEVSSSFERIQLGAAVETIRLFGALNSLTEINVDENNTSLCTVDGVVYSKDLSKLVRYPAGRTDTAFVVPDSVFSINSSAFNGSANLQTISLPSSVTYIEGGAFSDCTNLQTINLPEGLKRIGSNAFGNCTSLKTLSIPDSVTQLENYFCEGCTGLTSLHLGAGVSGFSERSSPDYPEYASYDAYRSYNYDIHTCTSLTSITVSDDNQEYSSKDGDLYDKDGEVLMHYAIGKKEKKVVLPEGVTGLGYGAFWNASELEEVIAQGETLSIGNHAFDNCKKLRTVTHGAVTGLGAYAFQDCTGLESITLAEPLEQICKYAFAGCTGLKEVAVPDSVARIEICAFAGCSGLKTVKLPASMETMGSGVFSYCSSLQTIAFPEEIATIDYNMFYNCSSLKSIDIPASVTTIRAYAFLGCNDLQTIRYGGSEQDYRYMTIEEHNGPLYNAKIEYGSSGGGEQGEPTLLANTLLYPMLSYERDGFERIYEIGRDVETCQLTLYMEDGATYDFWEEAGGESFSIAEGCSEQGRDYILDVEDNSDDNSKDTRTYHIRIWKDDVEELYTITIRHRKVEELESVTVNADVNGSGKATFDFDFNWFYESSYTYNHDLATAASALSLLIYGPRSNVRSVVTDQLGFTDFKTWDASMKDPEGLYSPYMLAHKKVNIDGKETEIVLVTIMGTFEKEWLDDFDSGTGETHEGFQRASDNVFFGLKEYLFGEDSPVAENADIKLLITGHSRGAAVANLLGKAVDDAKQKRITKQDVYVYTYATPNTTSDGTWNLEQYSNIFNIVNPEDFVTKVMPAKWGYHRYGITYVLPSRSTETAGKEHYVNYASYLKKLGGVRSELNASEYEPYEYGVTTLANYVNKVTKRVPNVRAYYNRNLVSGLDLPYNSIHSLHDLYRGLLGGSQSGDGWNLVGAVVKVAGTIGYRYGELGDDTFYFFYNNAVIRPRFATGHEPATYFAAMKSLTEAQLKQPRKIIQGIANCPVDITILDEEGTVAGRITDNTVDASIDSEDSGVTMLVDGESKQFYVPADGRYTVEITGNDDGVMDYTLCELDPDTGELQRICYQDVPVEDSVTMTQKLTNAESLDQNELRLDESTSLGYSEYLQNEGVGDLSCEVTVEGIGSANSLYNLNPGDYAALQASTDENNEFLGWYDKNGELLSKDAEYGISMKENVALTARFTNVTVPAEGLAFEQSSLTMNVGEQELNMAEVSPANATDRFVLYESSDESVATVDSFGIITAVSAGTAVITGRTENEGVTATCEVTVKGFSIEPAKEAYTWTGSPIEPDVTIYDGDGKVVEEKYYTLSFENNVNVGTATITAELKDPYAGTLRASFDINPKGTSLSKLKKGKKRATVQWKAQKKEINGYEIQYALKKNFKKAKTLKAGKSKTKVVVKKLKSRKKYFFRIRTYKTVEGKTYYSSWSKAKAVKVS